MVEDNVASAVQRWRTLGQAGVGQWPGHRIRKISPLFGSLAFRADPLGLAGAMVVRVEDRGVERVERPDWGSEL